MQDGRELGVYTTDASAIPYTCSGYLYLNSWTTAMRICLETGDSIQLGCNVLCPLLYNNRETFLRIGSKQQLTAKAIYHWEELAEIGWQWINQTKGTNIE